MVNVEMKPVVVTVVETRNLLYMLAMSALFTKITDV